MPSKASWRQVAQRFVGGSTVLGLSALGRRPVRCDDEVPSPGGEAPPPSPLGTKPNGAIQFENFAREWRSVSELDNWDGFRLEAATQVTKFMQASHTMILGTQMSETGYVYQFGPAFHSQTMRTMIQARCGLDGGVNGRWIQKLGNSFEMRASSQSHLKQAQRNMHDASLEYNGSNVALGAKAAWQGVLITGGSASFKLGQNFQVGGDLTAVLVNGGMLIGTLGARWQENQHTVSMSATMQPDMKSPIPRFTQEMRLQYVRRINERLALGTEYKLSYPDKDSGLSMGYEYSFRNARIQGLVDTDGKVACSVMDYQGMGFSGMIDYFRGDYKFGVLLHIVPPGEGQPMA